MKSKIDIIIQTQIDLLYQQSQEGQGLSTEDLKRLDILARIQTNLVPPIPQEEDPEEEEEETALAGRVRKSRE